MMRQLRELDRLDAGALTRRRDTGRLRRRAGIALVGGAVVVGGALTFPPLAELRSQNASDAPTEDGVQRLQPLGRPPEVPRGVGAFAFVAQQPRSDEPVAYDPCQRVEYAVNNAIAPAGGDELIDAAVREVERATGLVFVRRADTDQHADLFGAASGERRPVIIEWTTPVEVPDLLGFTLGVGGSTAVQDLETRESRYVSGGIALDTYQLEKVLEQPRGPAQVRAVVMHELGHVVGLDHVDDKSELMFEKTTGRLAWGPGDREGLAALGSGRCFPD